MNMIKKNLLQDDQKKFSMPKRKCYKMMEIGWSEKIEMLTIVKTTWLLTFYENRV